MGFSVQWGPPANITSPAPGISGAVTRAAQWLSTTTPRPSTILRTVTKGALTLPCQLNTLPLAFSLSGMSLKKPLVKESAEATILGMSTSTVVTIVVIICVTVLGSALIRYCCSPSPRGQVVESGGLSPDRTRASSGARPVALSANDSMF